MRQERWRQARRPCSATLTGRPFNRLFPQQASDHIVRKDGSC
ncbi:MAG: hypothetical protein OZSIB_1987 [Candidatus Ozemobacter sibiricus]|uniref:Uncharacterized protein n=1 Tax=Candidatus Ozemobacter sibiricus TaxID=2268124 RepID=A0A367ZJN9_9BACT|nr:MAG: hypothetical protein OZSIB_1987 [Candidatus Ozemobacter sibiricus]